MPALPATRRRWFAAPFLRWSVGILAAVGLGLLTFELLDISLFSRFGMPHEFCYLRDPKLVWLHVISDALIGIAYVSISATLAYLVYRASKGIPFHSVFLAFGLFIVSCGFTHFMEVWVIWHPVYWLSGFVKVITAAASLATAIALFPLLPRIFALIDSARQSERRRAEIEQLNRDLERFNYSVAHDLRAPLRSITGFAQILREDYAGKIPPDALQYVQRMERSAERMDALVNGLLRYATIGRQKVQVQTVPAEDAARAAIGIIEQEMQERRAEVRIDAPLPAVLGDPTLLQVVFQNLIANGIKFVAPGTTPLVVVAAEANATTVELTVTDNGIGFPPEARERVFGMFERFHPEHPGTGIGLAVVHRAVQRMHGSIKMEAGPGGRGTRFLIRLPKG